MYRITMSGTYCGTFFEAENFDDAMQIVSMLAEFGKVTDRDSGEDGTWTETVRNVSVTMRKEDK